MIKAVFLDLDGVLLDSFDAWLYMFNIVRKHYGKKELSVEEFKKNVWGINLEEIVKKYFSEQKLTDLKMRVIAHFIQYITKLKLVPQAKKVLKALQKKGMNIALVTNSNTNVAEAVLKRFFIRKYFDVLVCRDNVKKSKPAPDMLIKAAEELGVNTKEGVFVGDLEIDAKAGMSAGCLTLGYRNDFGDKRIDSLMQILDFV